MKRTALWWLVGLGAAGLGGALLLSGRRSSAAAPRALPAPAPAPPAVAQAPSATPPTKNPRTGKGVTLLPGLWWAGFHAPFIVSNSMVQSKAEELGFSNLRFFDRSDVSPPFDPRLDPAYRDDWDTWASGEYHGAPKSLELPAQPDWLLYKDFPNT